MKRQIVLFLTLFFLFGCTPQKRLNRLIKRHPYLVTTKYVTLHDSFFTKDQHGDTSFGLKKKTKSIIISSAIDLIFDQNGKLIRDTIEFIGNNYKGKAIVSESGKIEFNFEASYEAIARDTIYLKGKDRNGFLTRLVLDEDSGKLETIVPKDTLTKDIKVPVQEVKANRGLNDNNIVFAIFLGLQLLIFILLAFFRR